MTRRTSDPLDLMLLPPLPKNYTRQEALIALDELYEQLPAIECKGRCHDSCTITSASELERQRIAAAGGDIGPAMTHERLTALIADGKKPRCPSLGPLNTCTIYPIRPFLCRVYGMAEGLLCEHGCIPDGIISRAEAVRIMLTIEQLSRHVTGVASAPPLR